MYPSKITLKCNYQARKSINQSNIHLDNFTDSTLTLQAKVVQNSDTFIRGPKSDTGQIIYNTTSFRTVKSYQNLSDFYVT